jgi:hypothetical protein|tara:strand:+ start:607 stop:1458 length:852 start_codon:yes stop_codon:yes gene_type:complete
MFINPYSEPEQNISKDGFLNSFATYKSITSIISKTLHIYKSKYAQLLLISIIPFIPALILEIFYNNELNSLLSFFLSGDSLETTQFPNVSFMVYILLLFQLLLDPLALAAMIIALGRILIVQDTNIITAYYLALTRGYSLILNVVIFYFFILLFGFLSLYLIGAPLLIIWLIATIIYPHAIYFENSGPGFALFRSIQLLVRSWKDLFKFWIPLLMVIIIQLVVTTYVTTSIAPFITQLISLVFAPIVPIVSSLAYIHYRIKIENLSYIDFGNSVLNLGVTIEE